MVSKLVNIWKINIQFFLYDLTGRFSLSCVDFIRHICCRWFHLHILSSCSSRTDQFTIISFQQLLILQSIRQLSARNESSSLLKPLTLEWGNNWLNLMCGACSSMEVKLGNSRVAERRRKKKNIKLLYAVTVL